MIPLSTFAGRKIAVFGLGLSGRATVRALLAGGAEVAAWDDFETARARAGEEDIALENLENTDWRSISALVLAPGVPLTHPEPHWTVKRAKGSNVPIVGDTELFFLERARRAPDVRVIAITGTNGKSTTTALTTHVLKAAGFDAVMGGNIGEAVLDLPDFCPGKIYVIEMSSYQLDLTPGVLPDAAALLNISPDHIDRHGNIENYARVKSKIFANLGAGGAAVISLDDPLSEAIAQRLKGEFETIEISSLNDVSDGMGFSRDLIWEIHGGVKDAPISFVENDALRGLHNKQNAAFAFALARHLGAEPEAVVAGLMRFPGLVHRMEIVGRLGEHLIVNDSKATNAEATAQALSAFDNIYWIVGGRAKDGGLAGLETFFPKISTAYLVGESSDEFRRVLAGQVEAKDCGTIETAVGAAVEDIRQAQNGPAVLLLSPAAASFDQFANFELRGDAFASAVRSMDGVEMVGGRK